MIFTHSTTEGWRITTPPGESRLGSFDITLCRSGRYRILNENGDVVGQVTADLKLPEPPKRPEPPTPEEMTTADARALVCEPCSFNRGLQRRIKDFHVHTVKCDLCGCGGLSLIHGKCPKSQWPTTTPNEASA